MQRPKGTILFIEDSETLQQIVAVGLGERGYKVIPAVGGEAGLEALSEMSPDLVLLDLNLPDIDGFEVCKRLKSDPVSHHVPVIVVTSLDQTGFEVMAIEAGADDFVAKPLDPVVLDARISMIIRRLRRQRLANPLTGLPGSVVVEQRIASAFEGGETFAVCHADIDEFKAFNDYYGYARGDELLSHTAHIISEAAGYTSAAGAAYGGTQDNSVLVGHLGGDDFVYVCGADQAKGIALRIVGEFDATVLDFYDEEDRERGYFMVKDREGAEKKVGPLTISVAVVSTADRTFWSPLEMSDVGTELKAHAKRVVGSTVVTDRRREGSGGPDDRQE